MNFEAGDLLLDTLHSMRSIAGHSPTYEASFCLYIMKIINYSNTLSINFIISFGHLSTWLYFVCPKRIRLSCVAHESSNVRRPFFRR